MAAYAFPNLIITYYSKMLRQIQSSDITASENHTVWKFQTFPATHILREINVNMFGLKYLHFDRFEGYQFKFWQILADQNGS